MWEANGIRSHDEHAADIRGIGGLIGAGLAVFGAMRQFDFSVTDQMQQGVGYVLGGFIVGAVVGYLIGKSMKG